MAYIFICMSCCIYQSKYRYILVNKLQFKATKKSSSVKAHLKFKLKFKTYKIAFIFYKFWYCLHYQELQEAIRECLDHCNEESVDSIAFPAVGTGKLLKYPARVVARVLIKESVDWLKRGRNSKTNLKVIVAYLNITWV